MARQRLTKGNVIVAMCMLVLVPAVGCRVLEGLGDALDGAVCGNLICEEGESAANCMFDCPAPDAGDVECTPDGDDCPAGEVCVDGLCAADGGEPVCGNLVCDEGESAANCLHDCPAP